MKIFNSLKKLDSKILKITRIGFIFCLLLGLISTMILSFYHSTYILLQFYIGYTSLKLSIFFFVCFFICSLAFDRILKETK